ncbi:pyridoxal phosphate-dependent transferase [Jimgerdemannia flammicorona]|uniref:alanine--glyoxylate transaminase n=1 Tax=Jimgerdemannia flammicorona TaxID=994334 RepID=A0A433D864_9FUNG|nr:pyridoxal phosphate-dependent transferase [Jimgerdemannia flammicorona]
MSTPATSHVDPNFIPIFGESLEMLRKVLLTEKAQPLIVSGSGTLGWDMMCNLIEPGDNVLVLNTGYFGDKFGECLEVYGANVTHLRAPIGSRPDRGAVREALASATKPYKLVVITHVDTSTGVLSNVRSIAEVVHEKSPSTLVVVDGVCSVGSEEIRFDQWGLDIVLTASQKALGCPPGLAILMVSQKALGVFNNRKTNVPSYYASWAKWLPIMQAYESRKGSYFATPAVQLIYALHTSLRQILTSGTMEQRFAAHLGASRGFKQKIRDLGLRQLPESDEFAANGMTAIWLPEGISVPDLLAALAKRGVQIAGGLHVDVATKYFRIGHMGISVTRKHLDVVYDALSAGLTELGYKH